MIDVSGPFSVGAWRVEPQRHLLTDDTGKSLRLPPKTIEVLCYLAAHQGEVVSRSALLDQVWPSGAGGDDSLNNAISSLRSTFGDDRKNPRYIETVPKRGYRLAAPLGPNIRESATDGAEDPSSGHSEIARKIAVFLIGCALIGGLALMARWVAPGERREQQVDARPLTSLPGVERDAQLSPDGAHIAFSHKGDIYISRIDSDLFEAVTSSKAQDAAPVWSPSGAEVAFLRLDDSGCELLIKAIDAIRPRSLGACGAAVFPALSWHPTGRWLAYSEPADSVGAFELVLANTKTGARARPPVDAGEGAPVNHFYFRFSPDGEKIAFVRNRLSQDQVFYASVDAPENNATSEDESAFPAIGEPIAVPLQAERISGLDWLGNGDLIASIAEQYRATIKRYNINAASVDLILLPSDNPIFPMASNDGERFVWSDAQFDMDIWSAVLETPDAIAEQKIVNSTKLDAFPAISPDGASVAFTSTRTGAAEIWIADADGGNQRQLTSLSTELTKPIWSPDSSAIAFSALSNGQFDIWSMSADGSDKTQLTRTQHDEIITGWPADGATMIYFSDAGNLFSIRQLSVAEPGEERQLLGNAQYAQLGCANTQLFSFRTDADGLWRHDLASRQSEPFLPGLNALNPDAWTVGVDGVYYAEPAPQGRVKIMFASCAGGDPEFMGEISNMAPFHHLSLSLSESESGIRFLFAKTDHLEADIMISRVAD